MYFSDNPTNFETRNGYTLPSAHQPREQVTDTARRESVYGKVVFGDYFDGIVVFDSSETEVRVNGEMIYFHPLQNRCVVWATRHGLSFTHPQAPARVLGTVSNHDDKTYRDLQCEMFGAFSDAGISKEKEIMLLAINDALGTEYESRTEMSEREMRLVAAAARGGYFGEVADRKAA